MVATSTPVVSQAQDSEKRRKVTMEKAKANHLSRQLQMRLQYARLKVEHGWQRQTLNEVENLYFHHSYLRGPKPKQPSLLLATTQTELPQSGASSSKDAQSSLSFISRNAVTSTVNTAQPESRCTDLLNITTQSAGPSQTQTPVISPTLPPEPAPIARPASTDTTPSAPPTPVVTTPKSPQLQRRVNRTPSIPSSSSYYTGTFGVFMSPQAMDQSTSSHYPSSPSPSKSRIKPTKPPHKSLQAPTSSYASKDAFGFSMSGTTPAMTYDAFWSSHSPRGPSTLSRGAVGTLHESAISGSSSLGNQVSS